MFFTLQINGMREYSALVLDVPVRKRSYSVWRRE